MKCEYSCDRNSGLLLPRGMRGHPQMGAQHQALLMATTSTPGGGFSATGMMDYNNFAISNGVRTATRSIAGGGSYVAVPSITSHTSGKWYAEIQYISGNQYGTNIPPAIAVGSDGSAGVGVLYQGNHFGTYCYVLKGANGYSGPARTQAVANDIIMIAFDIGTLKYWFGLNGTWLNSGDPAAGTNQEGTASMNAGGSRWFVGVGGNNSESSVWISSFLSGEMTYSIPSGFSAWG
jgi:hypothetical protein